jgi:hypothetical protein
LGDYKSKTTIGTFTLLAREREKRSLTFRVAFEGAVPKARIAAVAARINSVSATTLEIT